MHSFLLGYARHKTGQTQVNCKALTIFTYIVEARQNKLKYINYSVIYELHKKYDNVL